MLLRSILAVIENNSQISIANTVNTGVNTPASPDKINLKNLYHISGGDEQFVKQMLVSFVTTTQKGLKDMQEASMSGQWDSVATLAHKLLPPCRHIGATDLCNLLSTIEKDIRNNDSTESIGTLTLKSFREFEAVSELLKEQIAKMN
jgi:HPt (histidine-containing phosphotransfer) domain-containing protein